MEYCTLDQIKLRLEIDPTETTWDNQLTSIRVEVEQEIDTKLKNYITVPLTGTIPGPIQTACAELTAIDWRLPKAPSPDAATHLKTLREIAIAKLEKYIDETYGEEIAFIVGVDTS